VRAVAHLDRFQPFIAADAVVHVDHQIAGVERGQFGQERVGVLALLLAAHEPVAEDVLLGQQFQFGVGEALLQRQHHGDGAAGGGNAQRFLPAFRQRGRLPASPSSEASRARDPAV
jgi:hypothetical protein